MTWRERVDSDVVLTEFAGERTSHLDHGRFARVVSDLERGGKSGRETIMIETASSPILVSERLG